MLNYRRKAIYRGLQDINCSRIYNYTGKVSSITNDKYLSTLRVNVKAFISRLFEINLEHVTFKFVYNVFDVLIFKIHFIRQDVIS